MLYIGQRIGDSHKNHCEDSHFVLEHYDFLILGVFDGCSTGKKSHFASELISKCIYMSFYEWLNNYWPGGDITNEAIKLLIKSAARKIYFFGQHLSLHEWELLSTIMISVYDKKSKTLRVCVIGDGFYKVDDQEFLIESPQNAPDYLAYHLEGPDIELFVRDKVVVHTYQDVNSFCICSDGITAIKPITKEMSQEEITNFLLADRQFSQSQAMLGRKFNILSKFAQFGDDITILRYEAI